MGGAVRFGVFIQGLGNNIIAFIKHIAVIAKREFWLLAAL